MIGSTFVYRGSVYEIVHASTPAERGLDYLADEYARCGWTHTLGARRVRGARLYVFHARVADDSVVLVSSPI